jgi:hypothetical protein
MAGDFLLNDAGMPLAPCMAASQQSVVRCLFNSTRMVTSEVSRLWARASNLALEQAVSRAVRKAKAAESGRSYTTAEVLKLGTERQIKELALLEMMGLVFPGSGPFLDGRGYVLFPPDSYFLNGSYRAHPFGILADSRELHVFAEVQDLRWASRKINEILHLHMSFYTGAKVFAHVLYHGVPPDYDNGLGTGWPLLAMPSIICQWHQPSAPGAHMDRVRVLTPQSSLIDRMVPLPPCHRWSDWTDRCSLIESVVLDATLRSKQARRVEVTDKAHQRKQVRQGPASRPYEAPDADAFHKLVPKPAPQPSMEQTHRPAQEASGATGLGTHLTPSWRDYAGPRKKSQNNENSQGGTPIVNSVLGGGLTPRILGGGGYGGSETLELLESRRRFEVSQKDPNAASAVDDELVSMMGQLLGGDG